jgi:hypothetical protein
LATNKKQCINIKNKIMKKIITLFFVIFCVNMIWAAKERIIIEYLSSEQQELELKRVSTIKFQNEFIDFVDFSGEVIAHREVKDVRKISFVEGGTDVENPTEIAMIVYPNPTTDYIMVEGKDGEEVRVYDLEGKCVYQCTMHNAQCKIDVSSLIAGTYIIKSNTASCKVIVK